MKILALNPWGMSYMDDPTRDIVGRNLRSTTELVVRNLGPDASTLPWPVAGIEASVVAEARRAEADGFDGILIACSADPHLGAVRDAVSIPVAAPTDAALHLSRSFGKVAILGRQMPDSFANVLPSSGPDDFWVTKAREYGFDESDFTVRRVPVPKHPDFDTLQTLTSADPELVRELTFEAMADAMLTGGIAQVEEAVEHDKADVVYFACTFWSRCLEDLRGTDSPFPVPVISPLAAGAAYLEAAITARGNSTA